MIDFTKLLCATVRQADVLRYGGSPERTPAHLLRFKRDKKPVVVWNSTAACNLRCVHCYYSEQIAHGGDGALTTTEAKAMIDGLADFQAPVLLFSGGEPLLRADLFELGEYAAARGIRTVISTNGTLIDEATAQRIKQAGFSYVGISLDGIEATKTAFAAWQVRSRQLCGVSAIAQRPVLKSACA